MRRTASDAAGRPRRARTAIGACSSGMNSPSTEPPSSPTGWSSDIGVCDQERSATTCSVAQAGQRGDLLGRRLVAVQAEQLALGGEHGLQLLVDVDRQANGASLVSDCSTHRLADPPGRVRRELVVQRLIELLDRADQAERALLDQVQERQPLPLEALGDRHDEPQVGLHHALLGAQVATPDALRERDLLVGPKQPDAADIAQEEVERVGRARTVLMLLASLFVH